MPYAKKNKRMYRKRNYRARFNDKRINTAIEKKIQDIAKKEDEKRNNYYVAVKKVVKDLSQTDPYWDSNISRPTYSNCYEMSAGTVTYMCLTTIGGAVRDASIAKGGTSPNGGNADFATGNRKKITQRLEIAIKQVSAKLTFINQLPYSVRVRACLLFIPNYNSQTEQTGDSLHPNIHMLRSSPNTKFDGLFGINHRLKNNSLEANSAIDAQIIDAKTIELPPASITYSQDTNVRSIRFKRMSLNQTYKREKNLFMSPPTDPSNGFPIIMSNGNYFLAIVNDAPNAGEDDKILCYGLGGVKWRLRGLSGSTLSGEYPTP